MNWQELQGRYQQLEQREKLLIVLSVLAVVYLAVQLLWLDPIAAKQQSLMAEQSTLRNDIQALEQQQVLLMQSMHQDPDEDLKRQIENFKQEIVALDKELNTLAVGLVSAQQLPVLLQDVLKKTGKLELLSVKTLPVSNLQLAGSIEATNSDTVIGDGGENAVQKDELDIVNTGVYKHAVELSFRGSYFQILSYLEALEGLAWRFYWQSLDYEVSEYPRARVRLSVYTLSTEEGLFSG